MKITDIYLKTFGCYRDWKFTPKEKGVHLIYGPNESGKTTLLMAMRALLFGFNTKEKKNNHGILTMTRKGKTFHLEREKKKTKFYATGEEALLSEPAELWWHGLDRKTYERIFALTVEDLQGVALLTDVEVRTRFFGVEGGEKLSAAVKDIEKTMTDLLVASANGKRKINILMERMQQNRNTLAMLENQEQEYFSLQQRLDGTIITEGEIQERLHQWREYVGSVDLVLRAWDTYKRAQEAKAKMASMSGSESLEREKFLALDEEISQCREHMRIWKGKEEGLLPENFAPDAPIGLYGRDIESLHQQLINWEELQRNCREGEAYIKKVKEQIALARKMHTTWRDDLPMPEEVDWAEGERRAQKMRLLRDTYSQWQYREPIRPAGMDEAQEEQVREEDIVAMGQHIEDVRAAGQRREKAEKELLEHTLRPPHTKFWSVLSILLAVAAVALYFSSRGSTDYGWIIAVTLLVVFGAGSFAYGHFQRNQYDDKKRRLTEVITAEKELLENLSRSSGEAMKTEDIISLQKEYENMRKSYYSRNIDLAKIHAYEQEMIRWSEEGKALEKQSDEAKASWRAWLPEAANGALTENDLFSLRQEYDRYMEQVRQLKGYEKRLAEHKDRLEEVEMQAKDLWRNLELSGEPTVGEFKRIYNGYKLYQQNMIRWEQKENQRRNYREEYDQWHRKEKDLLLRQNELLQKSGIKSASEYRQRLITQEQYRQWELILQQSNVQLKLLAPTREGYDLLCRRLQDGNKEKWLDESRRGGEEIGALEQKLADLYKLRGELSENLRNLSANQDRAKALQEKSQLEAEMTDALEDWATQVFIAHFIEQAQQRYEKEKQPQVVELASKYLFRLTKGRYGLETNVEASEIYVCDTNGKRLESDMWSSGLGDQIYLALRLSLATRFSEQVDPLPIVLDDILLRFDEERQKEALYLLAELSETEQIWVFTCQEGLLQVAEGLKEPRINRYRLDKGTIEAI